jgi:DNA-binding XRE family transcriptional regulator
MRQIELAHKCDLEKGNMYRIEAGKTNPTFLTLLKVAAALGVSVEEIVKGL